jgi:hypothetical protein
MEITEYGVGCGLCDWMEAGLANPELAERRLIDHVRVAHPHDLVAAQAQIMDGTLRPRMFFDHDVIENDYLVTCRSCRATRRDPAEAAVENWARDHLRDYHADAFGPARPQNPNPAP